VSSIEICEQHGIIASIKIMPETDISLEAMAEALIKSADYRVLRRLTPRETFAPSIGQSTKIAILLDVETTGLDQRKDEGLMPFAGCHRVPISAPRRTWARYPTA